MASSAAALISLKRTIQRLSTNHTTNPEPLENAFLAAWIVESMIQRLDRSTSSSIRSVINDLGADIREAAWELEAHMLRSYRHNDSGIEDEDLNIAIASFSDIAVKIRGKYDAELDNSLGLDRDGGNKSTLHQCMDISNEILQREDHPCRKIVSIVGMVGIGKTFLARKVYKKLVKADTHFEFTAWVSIGPNPEIGKVLVDILAQIERKPTASYKKKNISTVASFLRRSLYRRKYFIVLDDVWDTIDMKSLMDILHEHGNDSRFLLTTRMRELPSNDSFHTVRLLNSEESWNLLWRSNDSFHTMRLLDSEESWNLLWRNIFQKESFPFQLEEAGRKIAVNCEGLPLLILAVAKILRHLNRTDEKLWKSVADMKTTTFQDAHEKISEVLSLSYDYLPKYLRPCFLYMGVFPQSSEITLSKLINLWDVEDFLEPNQSHQSLQDFATECLEKLVSRNLVNICKYNNNYRIKSCKLHLVYWSFCVKEARKKQMYHVLRKITDSVEEYIENQCRISVQNNILSGIKEVYNLISATSTTRSLMFTGEDQQYPVPVRFDLMFLKVLDALAIRFYEFPVEVLKLLELKYLALTHNGNLPSLISNLQNLQTLIIRQHHNIKWVKVRDSFLLPNEIWDMQQLRHLHITGSSLPDPSKEAELPNLLTLHVKGQLSCSEDVFRKTPHLKKLGIRIELEPRSYELIRCFDHISILEKLESLKCVVVNPRSGYQVVAPPNPSPGFPRSLKKLSLNGLGYSWDHMSLIAILPKLEVLKLRCAAFQGAEWNTKVGEFQKLRFLLLEDLDLVEWTSDDDDCFPLLRSLTIRHCYRLREIPWQIEESATIIKNMEIVDCRKSLLRSAERIQRAKRENGHDSFQVEITSSLEPWHPTMQQQAVEESDDDETIFYF